MGTNRHRVTTYCYVATILMGICQLGFVMFNISPGQLVIISIAPIFLSSIMLLNLKCPPMILTQKQAPPVRIYHYSIRLTCGYFLMSLSLQVLKFQPLVIPLFLLYLTVLLLGIIGLDLKHSLKIYQNNKASRASIRVQLTTLLSLVVLVFIFLSACASFKLVNNTIEIMVVGFILVVNVIVIVVNGVLEDEYVKREKMQCYQPSSRQLRAFIIEIILTFVMVGVAWFTQGV